MNFVMNSLLHTTLAFAAAFSHCCVTSSFYPEELKSIKYEVDILKTPVKIDEEQSYPVFHLKSKYGQKYQCVLPHIEEYESIYTEKAETTTDENTDIKVLLKPIESGSCIIKTKGWWTYELCAGQYIKQYHIEDGKILGQVNTLGLYESDYDWNNETDKNKFKHGKQRYHSQLYSNGSQCDLTGLPRSSEVRFICIEDTGDYIYRIDEPGTCIYVLTVHTSRICSHPKLKPFPFNKAHIVSCKPLLSEEQFAQYLQRGEAEHNPPIFEQAKSMSGNIENFEKVLWKAYDEEIERLKLFVPPEKFSSVKNDIQKHIDSVINEAEEELERNLDGESKDIALIKLASTLNILLNKLQKAEKDVEAIKKLEKEQYVINSKSNGKVELLEEEDSKEAIFDDDKLYVRIRRLDRKFQDSDGKLHEMDFSQRKQLEQAVKEKLEKSALDTGGRRIEVKIITAGYYDKDDSKDFDFLSDDETNQFQNMILALITGQQEAIQEMERHKKLEENYRYVWNHNEQLLMGDDDEEE